MSKLPLAARHGVHRVLEEFRQASEKGDYSQRAKVASYIAFVVGQHLVQAALGVDIGLRHVQKGGSLQDLEAAYDGFYTWANLAVAYSSAKLGFAKLWYPPIMTGRLQPELGAIPELEELEPALARASTVDNLPELPRDIANTTAFNIGFVGTIISH